MSLGRPLFVLAALPLLLSGCAKPAEGTVLEASADGRYHIAMTSQLTFDPLEVRVPVGATVVWHNDATMVHDVAGYEGDPIKDDRTAFSSSDPAPEGLGRLMQPGEEFEHTFAEKGTWTVWCHTHHEQEMKGVVHVV
jgi:plastocyanin